MALDVRWSKVCAAQDQFLPLAETASMHHTYVSMVERGRTNLTVEAAHRLRSSPKPSKPSRAPVR
jgi:hypothetical protein